MSIDFAYGRGHLAVDMPAAAEVTVIRKSPLAKIADGRFAVRAALDAPIGAPSLVEAARGKRSACILICDITRPVPNHLFLRPMVEDLEAAGVPREAITILIATGLHRPNEGDELRELVGDNWIVDNIRIENHFARDDAMHVDLGVTATRGTPVKIDRRFVEAEVRIATGLVEPHFMAGYSGGRKVIAPGVAHQDTIRTFHNARFMEDPLAISCNLAGNPLHEEQLEIVKILGDGILGLNTVIDEERDLNFVSFGEIIASHGAAVDFVRASTEVPVGRKFNTVVTSSAGYPLDQTYYQTVKGMVTPLDILAPGGTLIIVSDCAEGMGSPEFRASQGRLVELGPDRFLETILGKQFADVDEWQTEMQLKPMRVGHVQLFSTGLPAADHGLTGVEMLPDTLDAVARAVAASIAKHGDAAVAAIPEGPYVIPFSRAA
ncbi:MAG: nickel-dependent lactate racemase [Thalassobaculaceae bacterium]